MLERQGRLEAAAKLAAKALETKQSFVYRTEAAEIVKHWQGEMTEVSAAAEKSPASKQKASEAK